MGVELVSNFILLIWLFVHWVFYDCSFGIKEVINRYKKKLSPQMKTKSPVVYHNAGRLRTWVSWASSVCTLSG